MHPSRISLLAAAPAPPLDGGGYLLPAFLSLLAFVVIREWWTWMAKTRLDQKLQASEARFRQVVESNMIGILFWDVHGRIFDANEALLTMIGFTRSDLEADRINWRDLTPPEYAAMDERAIAEIRAQGACTPFEKEYIRKDGSRIPVIVGGALLRGDSDRGVCFVINRAEREATRRALNEAQAHLQLFLEHSPALIFMKDLGGRYLHVNSSFERALERTTEEIIGRTDAELIDATDAAKYRAEDEAVKETGHMLEFQQSNETPSGNQMSLVQKFPLRDSEGKIAAIGGIVTDITGRHAAAEALRRSEERYRTLVEGAPDAIFSLGLDGVLTSANAAAERITGWPQDEWKERSFLSLLHPDDCARGQTMFDAAVGGAETGSLALSVQKKGGGFVVLEFTVTPQTEGGRVTGILGIGRDVTERRQLEKQLRQAQRMESIGQLAGGIAHDFNNLLTVIQGHTSLVALNDTLDEETRESIHQIADSAERAANLTRQLLAFSRQQVMQRQNLDLNAIVGNMMKMLSRLLGEDIALSVVYAPDLPPVFADAGMLEQIIMNLAVNARDAMSAGGKVELQTSFRQFSEDEASPIKTRRAGNFVQLSIVDHGSGIAPEDLPRIFEPFYTTKELGKGTGLGLATVYGAASQHQGWVEVSSALGKGTTFDVFLPAAEVPVEEKKPQPKPILNVTGGSECILLVEDEAPLRTMVRIILERYGYRVVDAASGVEALEKWRSHSEEIALVLTDMVLPDGLSGGDLAERLIAEKPSLKVVYTSGYTDRLTNPDLILEDGRNFVQKPYQPEKLARVIRENLDAAY